MTPDLESPAELYKRLGPFRIVGRVRCLEGFELLPGLAPRQILGPVLEVSPALVVMPSQEVFERESVLAPLQDPGPLRQGNDFVGPHRQSPPTG